MSKLQINCRNYSEGNIVLNDNTKIPINGYDKIGKAFHGDLVEIVNENIKVLKSNIKNIKISGVLELYSKYKFKTNKRGVEKFKFVPLSNNYPCFLVGTRVKKKYSKNILITIKYHSWNENLPYGEIIEIFGETDNINSQYDGILHKYDLVSKLPKIKKPLVINFDTIDGYDDITNHHVVSVDPTGCLDIDDAFSYSKINKNKYILGIHISDVVGTLKKLELNYLLNDLTTSIYSPHKIINMFPKILSNGCISLLQGKKRLAISLWISIDNNKIIKTEYKRSILINKKTYNYDSYKNIEFINLVKNLQYNSIDKHILENYDTHKMIEKLMIIYNCEVAKFIIKNGENPIFRIHTKNKNLLNNNNLSGELGKFLNIIKNKSAEYTFDNLNTLHSALNLKNYIHFTSPIRRYTDCYNHNIVHNILEKNNYKISINLEKINNINKRIKKAEREFSKIKFKNLIEQTKNNTFQGYIYNVKENFKASVYIPKYKLSINTNIIDKKLHSIHSIKIDTQYIYINNTISNSGYKLKYNTLINFDIYLEYNLKNPYTNLKIKFNELYRTNGPMD